MVVLVVSSILVYFGMTSTVELLIANVLMLVGLLIVTPLMPRSRVNRPIALYGSRFRPMPGERVRTAPTDAMALEDRPLQGSLPA